jgi:3-methyladenine DNA glycosylase AlkD
MNLINKFIKKMDKKYIDFLENLILKKSWWDTVDYLSAKFVGYVFKKNPELINPYTEKWMKSGNIWLHRSALLFQLKYKADTDEKLLYKYCIELSGSKEFFIRKAIGWTLREYSKTNPESVIKFIKTSELSNLSIKEGLKYINTQVKQNNKIS